MVYEILRIGKENAIKSDELCKKLDVTKGYLQKAIRREREAGKPICASYKKPFGYLYCCKQTETKGILQSIVYKCVGNIQDAKRLYKDAGAF